MTPVKGRPLILYIVALQWSLINILAQCNDEGKENALYYITRIMVGIEVNYSSMEKFYLALVFAVLKLRHYFLSHQITIVSKEDPLRYILSSPCYQGN